MKKNNRSPIMQLDGKTIVVWDGTSFSPNSFVEKDFKIYKSVTQTTKNNFILSEWLPINSEISGTSGTPLVIGVWTSIPNQNSNLSNIQQPLEYRFDNTPSGEIVYLRGQFALKSTLSATSIIIGTLPEGVRPRYVLKSTSFTNTSGSIEFDVEVRSNGEIVISRPIYGYLPTTPVGQISSSPYSINDIFFKPESQITPINIESVVNTTTSTTIQPPIFSDLTIEFVRGENNFINAIQKVRMTLATPLSVNLTARELEVNGYNQPVCSGGFLVVSSLVTSSFNWLAGETGIRENTIDGGITFDWFFVNHYDLSNFLEINGTDDFNIFPSKTIQVAPNEFIRLQFTTCGTVL